MDRISVNILVVILYYSFAKWRKLDKWNKEHENCLLFLTTASKFINIAVKSAIIIAEKQ